MKRYFYFKELDENPTFQCEAAHCFFDKKGSVGDQTMSFSWLFVMMFVAMGIVGGVVMFFGSDIDVRGIESAQFTSLVKECIMKGKLEIKSELTLEKLSDVCKFDSKTIRDTLILSLYKGEKQLLNVGDTIACDFKGSENNYYYPRCRMEEFSFEGVKYNIRVGSHQITKRGLA